MIELFACVTARVSEENGDGDTYDVRRSRGGNDGAMAAAIYLLRTKKTLDKEMLLGSQKTMKCRQRAL